ncbi:MAG: hypothetical protein KDI69_10165, partial [Xanthomonadales bacterium]|nr:hypothetical protein [Xanthomonadales bacterium]
LRIASCQINTRVGALDANVEAILAALRVAEEAGCDLAVLPELAITGYPPEDLLLRPAFVEQAREARKRLGIQRINHDSEPCVRCCHQARSSR